MALKQFLGLASSQTSEPNHQSLFGTGPMYGVPVCVGGVSLFKESSCTIT